MTPAQLITLLGGPGLIWNPAAAAAGLLLSNGNRTISTSNAGTQNARVVSPIPAGKWYWEMAFSDTGHTRGLGIGTAADSLTADIGTSATAWGYAPSDGGLDNNNAHVAVYNTAVPGDVIAFAIDTTAHALWMAINNVWQVGNPATGSGGVTISTGPYFVMGGVEAIASVSLKSPLSYAPPTGFSWLNL